MKKSSDHNGWHGSDTSQWPMMHETVEQLFVGNTLAQWLELCQDVNACLSPVLNLEEALQDPHNQQRGILQKDYIHVPIKITGFTPQKTPAPSLGEHTAAILAEIGFSSDQAAILKENHLNAIYFLVCTP